MKMKQRKFRLIVFLLTVIILISGSFLGYNILMKRIYPIKYTELIEKYSDEFSVEKSLIYAVIHTESHFRPDAVSKVGAMGLMQITPETFAWLQSKLPPEESLAAEALHDSEINIRYGVYFLSILQDEFMFRESILSAYHAGRGSVNKWLGNPEYSSDGITLRKIPFSDTNSYVEKVLKTEKIYKSIYKLEG